MSAEKAKAAKDAKKSMAGSEDAGRRQSTGGGDKGSFGVPRRKSKDMSKESKMKQKKADEAALRKNKVITYIYTYKNSYTINLRSIILNM